MAGAATAQFVPDRMKAIRVTHGWTRAQLAARLGMTRQLIWAWETGKVIPSAPALVKLGRLVAVPVERFFEPLPADRRTRKEPT
jgi:transcriptional regulator with XRE-family HTH domain